MSTEKKDSVTVIPVGRRGRAPTYLAKVGSGSSDIVVIKRARTFSVGQRIEFAKTSTLEGMSVGVSPGQYWKVGIIDDINQETGMLFISYR